MTNNPAYRAYARRFFPAMALYVAAIFAASFAIPEGGEPNVASVSLALLPGLAIVAVIWAMGRLLVELGDEYLRLLEVRKALVATGFTLAVTAVWGLLELYVDVPRLPVFFVFPIWCGGLGLGALMVWAGER